MTDVEDNVSMKDDLESGISSDEKEYEVEEIRDHSITKQGRKFVITYYIKWSGYDDSENTWEAEKNIYALDMIDNYWNAKSDQDPDKALYYKIHKKKIPQKSKAPVIPSSSSSSSSSNNQSMLQVERKKIEREAQPSSSIATPEPKEKESASQQSRISDMFQKTKSKEQPKSRKGKERETPIITKSTETEEDDQRKTRGITKKPNYADYYNDSDLMDVDDQSDDKSELDEVIDDPEYNNEHSDWQSIAQEVSYIGQEFAGAPLYCVIAWKNGKKSLHPCNVVKNHCPKLLVEAFMKEFTKQANAEPEIIEVDD